VTAFKFDPTSDIHVNSHDDSVTVRFNGDTFGFNPTTSGFAVTNDWNDRHFTMAFDENSILYHLTREDINDRGSGKQAMAPDEFIAEIYGYVRSIAPPRPKDDLDYEFVGRADLAKMKQWLEEQDAVEDTKAGLRFDEEGLKKAQEQLRSDPSVLGDLYRRVLTPVDFEKAASGEAGEGVFFYPTPLTVLVLLMYPDGYVGTTPIETLLQFPSFAGGSQIVDHLIRSMSPD
jgi:hypothetical protein